MFKRLVLALFMSIALVATMQSPAAAAEYDYNADGNDYGSWACGAYFHESTNANGDWISYTCTVSDKMCDGFGVFIEMDSNMSSGYQFSRETGNAGGCGKSKTFKDTRYGSLPWKDLTSVPVRLCRDIPNGNDICYSGTIEVLRENGD